MKDAFTLIEILIVISIIGFIVGFSTNVYNRINKSQFLVEEGANLVVNVLKLAKEKSIIGEENNNWGVWLINSSTSSDYLYLFKGSTTSLSQRFDLPKEITFFDFDNKTITFQKNSGETMSTTIKIGFYNSSILKYIKVSEIGNITINNNP